MKKNRRYRTDFLFPTPSFLLGAGSVFNVAGKYFEFNTSSSSSEADLKAIMSDWGIVGQDIRNAKDKIAADLKVLTEQK
ncbi:hypothetical protein QWY31_04465 [Cytophagales bacterium LB-30]|uniref:Uncharacterized protein n=1 Tax=Shiella aurantiaca TaxID=3058365 RepID=A0ABT8F3E8_9BACT|nr:hypothetical protein [Shiella aurantiaca]MDN4164741.1 hypothetical protein [Shiella aurantiaca]